MSLEDAKKTWTAHLPGILTGSAALIAALTTVFINLRDDKSGASTPVTGHASSATSVVVAPAVQPLLAKPAAPLPQALQLKLARLRVDNDGTLGSTDWTFDIQSGGRSLFAVPFKGLTDKAGANLVAPAEAELASSVLTLKPGKSADIIVNGWKQGWVGKAAVPDVVGQAQLNAEDGSLVIEAKAEKAGGPAFVLYFDTRLQKSH